MFIEDNCFNNTNGHAGGWIDGYRGGRYVYRYNHAYDSAPTNHGTEIGRGRGLRCMEVYNNDFHWNSYHSSVGGIRSGGLITHDNTSDGVRPDRGATMGEFGNFANFTTSPWTQANGTNPWDSTIHMACMRRHSRKRFRRYSDSGHNQELEVELVDWIYCKESVRRQTRPYHFEH